MLENARFRKRPAVPELFRRQEHGEEQPPQHKVPCRTVPKAGQQPDNQNIAQPHCFAHAVAAERDIHIVAEP